MVRFFISVVLGLILLVGGAGYAFASMYGCMSGPSIQDTCQMQTGLGFVLGGGAAGSGCGLVYTALRSLPGGGFRRTVKTIWFIPSFLSTLTIVLGFCLLVLNVFQAGSRKHAQEVKNAETVIETIEAPPAEVIDTPQLGSDGLPVLSDDLPESLKDVLRDRNFPALDGRYFVEGIDQRAGQLIITDKTLTELAERGETGLVTYAEPYRVLESYYVTYEMGLKAGDVIFVAQDNWVLTVESEFAEPIIRVFHIDVDETTWRELTWCYSVPYKSIACALPYWSDNGDTIALDSDQNIWLRPPEHSHFQISKRSFVDELRSRDGFEMIGYNRFIVRSAPRDDAPRIEALKAFELDPNAGERTGIWQIKEIQGDWARVEPQGGCDGSTWAETGGWVRWRGEEGVHLMRPIELSECT